MSRLMKRLVSLVLVLTMMLSMASMPVHAEGDQDHSNENSTQLTQTTSEGTETVPTATPTAEPTQEPTATPTAEPTQEPTATPTAEPTQEPTATPTAEPTQEPTATPTAEPTQEPTATPTAEPTQEPTATPIVEPTNQPDEDAATGSEPTVTPNEGQNTATDSEPSVDAPENTETEEPEKELSDVDKMKALVDEIMLKYVGFGVRKQNPGMTEDEIFKTVTEKLDAEEVEEIVRSMSDELYTALKKDLKKLEEAEKKLSDTQIKNIYKFYHNFYAFIKAMYNVYGVVIYSEVEEEDKKEETPVTPTEGEAPVAPETPTEGEAPVTPTEGETPAAPETPTEGEAPVAPETPTEGEAPTAPETTAEGEAPAAPETTTEGEAPAAPETTTEGEAPVAPETASEGEAPVAPETPTEGEAPVAPETTTESEAPVAPETTTEGEVPAAPETPTEGEAPVVPETASEGEAPVAPETTTEGEVPVAPETTTEGEAPETTTEGEAPGTEPEIVRSELYYQVDTRIDEILMTYFGKTEMTYDETVNAVIALNGDQLFALQADIAALEESVIASEMSNEEIQLIAKENPTFETVINVIDLLFTPMIMTAVNVLEGQVTISDSANSNTVSNGIVTIKASGNLFSKKTNNITITNETSNTATLSFDYSVTAANSFKIAGATAATSGNYSILLEPAASVSITLVSNNGLSNTTATLTLSNFSLVEAAASSNVTFVFDDALGDVTYKRMDETTSTEIEIPVANGDVVEIPLEGTEITATHSADVEFFGWVYVAGETAGVTYSDGQLISKDKSFTLKPAEDMIIKPLFVNATDTTGYWSVNNESHVFDDINKASAFAASDAAKTKVIVLLRNATLPTGEYNIPSGVTLLIPFDDANTLNTTEPSFEGKNLDGILSAEGEYIKPVVYRTLTLASGVQLIVEGALSVSAKQSTEQKTNGYISTSYGKILMESNSKITVNSGASLYAWGLITGSGTVEVKSEATAYEGFWLSDWRGGSAGLDMVGNSNRVFPMSQYAVRNVEVPMTIHRGASEYGYMSAVISKSHAGSDVPFIGSSGMFNITSGYVVKSWTGNRMQVDVYGDLSVSPLKVSVSYKTINSDDYELPIHGGMTVNVHSGTITLNQSIELHPGSELIIGKDAHCILGSGQSVFVYDADNFKSNYSYNMVFGSTRDARIIVNGSADLSAGDVYTTKGDVSVSGEGQITLNVSNNNQSQLKEAVQSGTDVTYEAIDLTNVKLKNGDGSYTVTANTTTHPNTFTYTDDRWTCATHTPGVAATCTTAQTCTVCGVVLEAAKGHTPGAEATCTTAQTCTECGEQLNAALGHSYDDGVVTIEPTCTTDGEKTFTCQNENCDDGEDAEAHKKVYTEVVAATGHTEEIIPAVKATCDTAGATEGKKCSVCKEVLVAQEIIDALGHSYTSEVTKSATCTEAGETTFTCGNCGDTYTEEIKATGHSYSTAVTAPTCEDKGYTTYTCACGDSYVDDYVDATGHTPGDAANCTIPQICTECEKVLEEAKGHTPGAEATCTTAQYCEVCEEELAAELGHNSDKIIPAVAADCVNGGSTEGKRCSRCDEVMETPTITDPLGHDEEVIPGKDATCTETGLTEGMWCKRCEETTVKQEVIDALGHDYQAVVTEPTCTTGGYTTYTCANCGDSYEADKVAALEHKYDDGVVTKEPDCTEAGVKTYTCAECGGTKTEDIASLGHAYEPKVTMPTCEDEGYTTYTCANCGDFYKADKVAALGHKYNAAVTEPTCTDKGFTTYTCENCQDSYTADEVAANGHTPGAAATCTDDQICTVCKVTLEEAKGHTPGAAATCTSAQTCTVCGEELEAKLEHDYDAVVTAPTCEDKGYTTYTCSGCGDSYVGDETAANGHDYDDGVVTIKPTCTDKGEKTYTCVNCDDSYTEEIAANGHKPGAEPTCTNAQTCTVCGEELEAKLEHDYDAVVTAPTCEEEGYTTYTCSGCGDSYVADKTEANGHDYDDGVVTIKPTCVDKGEMTYSCANCDDSYTEEIASNGHKPGAEPTCTNAQTCTVCGEEIAPKLDHTEETIEAKEPTCTETGLTEGKKCAVCGETLVAQEEIPMLDHAYDEGVETLAPSCEADGEKTYTCVDCGGTATEPIPMLGHDPVQNEAQTATCENIGWDAYETCSRCEYTTYVEIPALGHDWDEGEIVFTPDCVNNGLKKATCLREECGVYSEEVIIPALGHTEVVEPAKAPTCTEEGYTESSYCSVCKVTVKAKEFIDALGHNMDVPSCQNDVSTCLNGCGLAFTEKQDHVFADATCTEPKTCIYGCGTTEGKANGHDWTGVTCANPKTCLTCGATEGVALEHTLTTVEAKKATYTKIGWNEYQLCEVCGYKDGYEEIEMLPAPVIETYDEFMMYLPLLEELAFEYVKQNPGKDPVMLVIKYIRTGVDRYNSGSWGIMAGYEDAGFAKFVAEMEDMINSSVSDEEMLKISGLKNIENFNIPNGDEVDFGHMFGTMDITYNNKGSVNHADVGGWAGDLVDLLSTIDRHGVYLNEYTFEEMVADVEANYLCKSFDHRDLFSQTDMYGDLDAFYVMQTLNTSDYNAGDMAALMQAYFTESLDNESRAAFLLKNRLGGVSLRSDIRDAVFNAYTGNKVIATLEGTREFNADDLTDMRKASCYAFADYLCRLAGDFVDVVEGSYYTVFSSKSSTLAPGITQKINYATTVDGKQIVYYTATADVSREDVHVIANYVSRYPEDWAMARVLDQANNAQALYADEESEHYIPNFNAIASINAGGYDMSNGDPGGLLVMHGEVYKPIGSHGFFAILKSGKAVIGTTAEWSSYASQVDEAIGGFGTVLVKDGKIAITANSDYYNSRAPRSAVGITGSGKVVFMVLDGRQEPFSAGGSMQEIAQIMFEAGCVNAINLDGGGSSTFVSRQEGDAALSVVNSPSDGAARSVSTSLLMYSTAPSSTAFDHAVLETRCDYMTIGTSMKITPVAVSATGNAVEMPEGTTWTVSDERWGEITEDGLLTAKRNGDIEVYLMLDGEVVGEKTLHIVVPDQLYFTKSNVDAVYGDETELPVRALYENKQVAINESDVVFTLDNAEAGKIEGFYFTGYEESGIRAVKITAALAQNSEITASVTVTLYKHGENSFDFDQATGGDRMLAWDREVSNSTTDDEVTYNVVNPDEAMVTSYVIALDMTSIPIPDQLAELTYMLPGADMEGASAWSFLLQLAERVSVLTEVTPIIHFDKNFDVDVTEIKLINDYFTLEKTEIDETENTVKLTLRWIDRTAAIDPATANPLCIVSGIKLTPKDDAAWDSKNSITAVNTGNIGYKIYLRANALYSFCQKPENQATFGLKPFVNPNDSSERGGYFTSNYADFSDTYTLVNALKNGWINEDGGYAYYVDGERTYGIKEVEGLYYDFGEKGVNVGKNPYTGLFFDEVDSVYRYAKLGQLMTGWVTVDGNWHYFKDCIAVSGKLKVGEAEYEFEENGKLVSGVWVENSNGWRYYYGPSYVQKKWYEIDGKWYYFINSYRATGLHHIGGPGDVNANLRWRVFDENGVYQGPLGTGIFEIEGIYYYLEDGAGMEKYLIEVEGEYYFATYQGKLVTNETIYAWETNCDMPKGRYTFGPDGKMIRNGIIEVNGVLYYYENGEAKEKGLVLVDNEYYFTINGGKVLVDQKFYAYMTSCDLDKGHYEAGSDGKLVLNGIYYKSGAPYYFENSRGAEKGLFQYNGNYYFAQYKGKLVTNAVQYAYLVSCDLTKAQYEFDAEGKMMQGVYDVDGTLYYYELGKRKEAGLVKVGEDYYFTVYGGEVYVDKTFYAYMTSCDLDKGRYEAGSDGKLVLNGIYYKSGVPYYFENSRGAEKGLFQYNGNYYFAQYKGKLVTNAVQYAYLVNCDLPKTQYEFDAEGKMMQGVYDVDGTLYYYELGKRKEAGLVKVGEDYYFTVYDGEVYIDKSFYAYMTSCDLDKGHYEAGSDGKLVLNGIYYKSGAPYYFENSRGAEKGLFQYNGNYYFAQYKGKLVTNAVQYAYLVNCDLPKTQYEFDAEGKMMQGVYDVDGTLYYYELGKRKEAGLVKVGEDYYFAVYGGEVYIDKSFYAYMTNCDLSLGRYDAGSDGKLILNGIYLKNNHPYYFENSRGVEKGLIFVDGSYYFAKWQGKLAVSERIYAYLTNCDLPVGHYEFGADGRMILDGIVEKDGILYYYEAGKGVEKGLICVDGDYYFAEYKGKLSVNKTIYAYMTSCDLPRGTYTFGADGKMVIVSNAE